MGIVDEDVTRVREATDVVAVVSEYTQLKRVGRQWQGLCPFHDERTGSFSVDGERGFYHCFGCGVGGDIIDFVREKELLDFVGAVEWLAAKARIPLRYTDSNQSEERRRRSALSDAVGRAVEFYHQRLLTGPDAGPARSYLRQRGIDGDVVRAYRLGWSPDGWDALARGLRLSDQDLTDSGLGFVNRVGRQQDAFRARVMFPIFDAQGRAVGFGGRNLPGAEGSKYKNSSESTGYAKSRVLYGLNGAKTAIVEADEVIVCEGYTDVIGFARAGAPRAVATCGTALTEEHVKLLRRFAPRVVLAFDADKAGQDAAARFYEWEETHDLDVAVADLPAGLDPGELAVTDPARLLAAITGARPFLEFRVDRAISRVDRTSGEGRARAAQRAMEMVAEHPNPLVRDQYVMTVASRCQVDPDLLRRMLAEDGARLRGVAKVGAGDGNGGNRYRDGASAAGGRGDHVGPGRAGPGRVRRDGPERDHTEMEALRLVVNRADEIADLLVPELFVDPMCATVYHLVTTSPSLHDVVATGGPEVAEVVQRLAVDESAADPLDVAGLLWAAFLDRQIDDCRREAREVDADGYARLAREMEWYRLRRDDLRVPDRAAATVAALLGWFLGSAEEGA
ncbi:MAG: DNA primase [Acidimicrobiales bacterium]